MKTTSSIPLNLTIGADPEMFLMRGEVLFSAIGLIGGSKYHPKPLGEYPGYFVQEDNVAVEFNIPPAETLSAFCDSIAYGVDRIHQVVEPYGMKPVAKASAVFPLSELLNPAAQQFGCDPDYNAWKNGQRNRRPRVKNERLRSCGGHIHVGYNHNSEVDKFRALQLMDLYLGVPSILMDDDTERRKLYGKAGSYRDTTYGFEYRTLSNFWLGRPELVEWAYTQTVRAMNHAAKFGTSKDYDKFMESYDLRDEIPKCINKSNPNIAQRLAVQYDLDVR